MQWVWLVDPLARTVEVFELRDGVYALIAGHDDGDTLVAAPFAAVTLPMAQWWLTEAE